MNAAKKTAINLIKHYYDVVYPYVGSDFMTGTENAQLKFTSAKKEASFLAQCMLNVAFPYEPNNFNVSKVSNNHRTHWAEVMQQIGIMNQDEFEDLYNLKT